MKYQTLTSTLVLTLLLAGPGAQAMDLPEETNDATATIQSPKTTELDKNQPGTSIEEQPTEADWLRYSQLNPTNFQLLKQALSAGTHKDKDAALNILKEDIEKKKPANVQEAKEEENVLNRLLSWFTRPSQQTLPPSPEVLNAIVAIESLPEVPPTAVLLKVDGNQPETTPEEQAPSYFSKFNPWSWWGGSAPTTDAVDKVVAEFVPVVPVDGSAVELVPLNSGTTLEQQPSSEIK